MFYHDHSWGITRLNVYVGGAAGYVIRDAVEPAADCRWQDPCCRNPVDHPGQDLCGWQSKLTDLYT